MVFEKLLKKIVFRSHATSESLISHLRKQGVEIGDNTCFFYPHNVHIDATRPYMLKIGSNVQITRDVSILTHGYDWSVLKGAYGDVLGSCGKVEIGNNVFIGFGATILKGVTIGDNVIIGAGSLVTHDIPANTVAAGCPCKPIMTLSQYYEKRQAAQLDEAYEQYACWRSAHEGTPLPIVFREFFWLFAEMDEDGHFDVPEFERIMHFVPSSYNVSIRRWRDSKHLFSTYDEFLAYCSKRYSAQN